LARLDQRTGLAKRIAAVTKQLSDHLKPRRRLTGPERDALARTAQLQVLAEVASRRALIGEIPVQDAVRANTAALRAERALRAAVVLEDSYYP
jgi:hypothetical protein